MKPIVYTLIIFGVIVTLFMTFQIYPYGLFVGVAIGLLFAFAAYKAHQLGRSYVNDHGWRGEEDKC
jgi:hypothetical protein